MRDIAVVGSLNVDISLELPHLARPGETVRSSDLAIGPGGKGLNQAIAAARLGGRVHMVGRLGGDAFADVPRAALEEARIDTTHVQVLPDERSGLALIQVDASTGQNAIATFGGANHAVTPAHVEDAIAVFRSSGVLLVQLELPADAVAAAVALAKQNHVTVVLDPAPARALDDALLRQCDVLTPNEIEAEALTGVPVTDIESGARAGAKLRERSGGDVIVTLGAQGCVWCYATGFDHVPAPRVTPVDTTGAGDAFNGGLAVGLARGESIGAALDLAVRAGSAATLRRGAAAAMPGIDEIPGLLS